MADVVDEFKRVVFVTNFVIYESKLIQPARDHFTLCVSEVVWTCKQCEAYEIIDNSFNFSYKH